MRFLVRVSIAGLLYATSLSAVAAEASWLIASQSESIAAGKAIELQVVRPSDKSEWPTTLHLRLIAANGSETRIPLQASHDAPKEGLRRLYSGKLETELAGLVRAELTDVASNRLALIAAESKVTLEPLGSTQPIALAPKADTAAGEEAEQHSVVLEDAQLPALSVNEPIYFVVNGSGDARFQLSLIFNKLITRKYFPHRSPTLYFQLDTHQDSPIDAFPACP